jgi:hypothetical protein
MLLTPQKLPVVFVAALLITSVSSAGTEGFWFRLPTKELTLVVVVPFVMTLTWVLTALCITPRRFAGPEVGLYSDGAILRSSDDELTRDDFVAGLAQSIKEVPEGKSVVIGVYGDWGEGKTSVLNLLRAKLRLPGLVVVDFDPWCYAGRGAILTGFYSQLGTALGEEAGGYRVAKLIRMYVRELSVGYPPVSIGLPLGERSVTLEERREEIETLLRSRGVRLVVMMDDIDRLDMAEMLSVFGLLRASGNLPNVVFVVAMDPKLVGKRLAQAGFGADFVSKIVQVPLYLPVVRRDQITVYFDRELNRILASVGIDEHRRKEVHESEPEQILHLVHLRLDTLRRAKRVLNVLRCSLPVVWKEIHLGDVVAMAVIETCLPELYSDIRDNRHFYARYPRMMSDSYGFNLSSDAKDDGKVVRDHLDPIVKRAAAADKQRQESVETFLSAVFFIRLKRVYSTYHYDNEGAYRRQRRIAVSDNLDYYLVRRYASGTIPTYDIERTLDSLNAPGREAEEAEKLVVGALSANTLETTLDALLVWLVQVTPAAASALARALGRSSDKFVGADEPFGGDFTAAYRMFVRLANDRVADQDLAELLSDVVRTTPRLMFAYRLCEAITSKDLAADLNRLQKSVRLGPLVKVLLERIKREIIEPGLDVMASADNDWAWRRPLDALATGWWGESTPERELASGHLMKMIGKDPRRVVRFVRSVADPFRKSFPEIHQWRTAYDMDAIADVATAALRESSLTDDDREFLNNFVDAVVRTSGAAQEVRAELAALIQTVQHTQTVNLLPATLKTLREFLLQHNVYLEHPRWKDYFDRWLTSQWVEDGSEVIGVYDGEQLAALHDELDALPLWPA